ncbi:MAG: hypothetical protein ABIW57_08945 [Polyangia bacterium]
MGTGWVGSDNQGGAPSPPLAGPPAAAGIGAPVLRAEDQYTVSTREDPVYGD